MTLKIQSLVLLPIKYSPSILIIQYLQFLQKANFLKLFNTLWRRLTKLSLYSWLPSTIPVNGFENHSLNSEWDWKTLGIRKCIKDHNSISEFWRGVPVSNNLRWLEKFRSICQRWDLKFLIFWACKYKINNVISKYQMWQNYWNQYIYERNQLIRKDLSNWKNFKTTA